MQRAEIVDVEFGEQEGHEAGWRRPALVVSDDSLAEVGLLVVCPITRTRLGYPSHVEIESGSSGLPHTSYIQTELVRSVRTGRVRSTRGTADVFVMNAVDQRLRILLRL